MTQDEQEARSLRYIAPRAFRLSSGAFALVDMLGQGGIVIFESGEGLLAMIPTVEELESANARLERAKAKAPDSLEDLGL